MNGTPEFKIIKEKPEIKKELPEIVVGNTIIYNGKEYTFTTIPATEKGKYKLTSEDGAVYTPTLIQLKKMLENGEAVITDSKNASRLVAEKSEELPQTKIFLMSEMLQRYKSIFIENQNNPRKLKEKIKVALETDEERKIKSLKIAGNELVINFFVPVEENQKAEKTTNLPASESSSRREGDEKLINLLKQYQGKLERTPGELKTAIEEPLKIKIGDEFNYKGLKYWFIELPTEENGGKYKLESNDAPIMSLSEKSIRRFIKNGDAKLTASEIRNNEPIPSVAVETPITDSEDKKSRAIQAIIKSIENAQKALEENQKVKANILKKIAALDLEEAKDSLWNEIEEKKKSLQKAIFKGGRKKEIADLETKLERMERPLLWSIVDKMSRKNYEVVFGSRDKTAEIINSALSNEEETYHMDTVLKMPPALMQKRDEALYFTLNGFYLRLMNRKELEKNESNVYAKDAKYNLVGPDGLYILVDIGHDDGVIKLKELAGKYQTAQKVEFENLNNN